MVTIHVYDETKKATHDFVCERNLLIAEMQYFEAYLADSPKCDKIEISVHCDVKIFHWLINYVKATNGDKSIKKPSLTPKIVVSILISSDFLQMKKLVKVCLQFCHDNINAVIKAPTNMNCITSKLLSRLCNLFEHKDLGLVKDPKDKFISKLFWKKLERAFSPGKCQVLLEEEREREGERERGHGDITTRLS